jgi:hypothetical protein
MLHYFAKHHNKIQFFGYEVANLVLVAQQLWLANRPGYGLNAETLAALSLLLGSAFIWRFDPRTRPHLLFYGGLALACGGAFLTAAGYVWTGLSVVLASLETARGGRAVLDLWIAEQQLVSRTLPLRAGIHVCVAAWSLNWYCRMVDALIGVYPGLGRFINERPFITGTVIKAPLRLEFIGKKLLLGDWIGIAVGFSWLLLGDLALALNDPGFQAYAERIGVSYPLPGTATEQTQA